MANRSWVWNYAVKIDDKAHCKICPEENNAFACPGGTTGSIARHLRNIHNLMPSCENESVLNEAITSRNAEHPCDSQPINKRQRRSNDKENRPCNPKQEELINQSLAKMIALNQLPLSFCASEGFKLFMGNVEPNYKVCTKDSIKARLEALRDEVREQIKMKMQSSVAVACTSDCWSSRSQDCYLTITADIVCENWEVESFTLGTYELQERHTAENIADLLYSAFCQWEITDKVICIITGNATNMTAAVTSLELGPHYYTNLTCAAHSIQLAVQKGLKSHPNITPLLQKASKVVTHFKHSTSASRSLKDKQDNLHMPQQTLLQSCATRWNSTYYMLERLIKNRMPIINVFADRGAFTSKTAQEFHVTECDWLLMEELVNLLKPLEVFTSLSSSKKTSPLSIVRPALMQIIRNYFQITNDDEEFVSAFKSAIADDIKARFQLEDKSPANVTTAQADLEHENVSCRQQIREFVKNKLQEEQNDNETGNDNTPTTSLWSIIYKHQRPTQDSSTEFQSYLSEPQLDYESDPFLWWKEKTSKYPNLSLLARKFLSIPATSTSSERCFSTAGNIVTSKRSCLLPDNETY